MVPRISGYSSIETEEEAEHQHKHRMTNLLTGEPARRKRKLQEQATTSATQGVRSGGGCTGASIKPEHGESRKGNKTNSTPGESSGLPPVTSIPELPMSCCIAHTYDTQTKAHSHVPIREHVHMQRTQMDKTQLTKHVHMQCTQTDKTHTHTHTHTLTHTQACTSTHVISLDH